MNPGRKTHPVFEEREQRVLRERKGKREKEK